MGGRGLGCSQWEVLLHVGADIACNIKMKSYYVVHRLTSCYHWQMKSKYSVRRSTSCLKSYDRVDRLTSCYQLKSNDLIPWNRVNRVTASLRTNKLLSLKWWAQFPLTKKLEELLLAWMIMDLDRSGLSHFLRVLILEQNFR